MYPLNRPWVDGEHIHKIIQYLSSGVAAKPKQAARKLPRSLSHFVPVYFGIIDAWVFTFPPFLQQINVISALPLSRHLYAIIYIPHLLHYLEGTLPAYEAFLARGG